MLEEKLTLHKGGQLPAINQKQSTRDGEVISGKGEVLDFGR